MRRRNVLKKLGGTASILALASQQGVAKTSEVVRTIDVDTARYPHLDDVTVTLFEDGRIRTDIDGTRPPNPTEARGYRVVLENVENESDEYTPEQATAEIDVLSPSEFLSERSSDSGSLPGVSQSGSASDSTASPGVNSDAGSRENFLMDHGGDDGEYDYEGGVWTRSEDIVDIDLCYLEGWIDWTTSGGEVDYVEWKWHAVGCDTGCSTWYIDDAGKDYIDWSGDDVDVKYFGDFYNWDFDDDDEKTEAFHRIWTSGNPDGSMNWWTNHWHDGEYSGSLRVDAGWFSDDDTHANHCAQSC